jgi:hypothetical protein
MSTETKSRRKRSMHIERALRIIAGSFILLSAALAWLHSPYWILFTAFVGLNLFQSGFTNWCPMVWILERAGLPHCGQAETPAHGKQA